MMLATMDVRLTALMAAKSDAILVVMVTAKGVVQEVAKEVAKTHAKALVEVIAEVTALFRANLWL